MGFLTRLLAGLTAAAALGTGLAGTANAVDVNGATGNTKSVVKLTADGGNETSEDTADNPDDDSTDADSTTDAGAQDASGQVPSNETANTVKQAKAKTDGSVKPVADTVNGLPTELVNGDFQTYGNEAINRRPNYELTFVDGSGNVMTGKDINGTWSRLDSWDSAKFGWKSNDTARGHSSIVEVQRPFNTPSTSATTNVWGEIAAASQGKYIYQDIATTPGVMYKWSIKHASRNTARDDSMQVLIGDPGKEIAQEATRTTSNGSDKTGKVGTMITTHGVAQYGQWETYTSTYIATSNVTRFTFKSVTDVMAGAGSDSAEGNCIDDVMFTKAYKLSYDKNASDATGSVPSNQRGKENAVQPAESKTDGIVKTVSDDAAGRTVLECRRSGEGATGPYADKFCWIDWSNLPLSRTGEPIPVRINVPGGHIDADATITHTDNAALTTKDFTGDKWSRLIPAYRLTGNTALAFHHIQGNSADPLASVMFSNITPVANQTAASVNVLKDFQLAFGDAETMSGYVVNDRKTYEQTDIESDKTLDKLGMIGDDNPNQSYSEANIGYGTTHVTLAGGPAGKHAPFTDESNSKGAAVIGATQPTRFKVSFKQVNHPVNNAWSAIAVGVYLPYLTAYPLTYDKNSSNATGEVPSNQRGKENTVQPAKAKTTGTVRAVADRTASGLTVHDLKDATGSIPSDTAADTTQPAKSETDGKVSDLVQRTTTHEDGSVTVRTIDTSTDVVSGCQVYYPAGQRITLATMAKDDDCWDSSMLSRPGHTQLGWNQDRNATQAQAQVTMVEGGMTVYAVWVGNPVLTYDTNKPSTWSGQMPSTPASVSVPYNTAAADGSGWRAGDTTMLKPGGYKFLGWFTGPQDNAGPYDWNTPLTGNVTVYAHWQRLQANVIYNANGGTGSHANTTGWQYSDVTIPGDTSKSFKRDGYVFLGWDTQADGNGTAYKDGSQVPLQDKDITLYAQWQPVFEQFTPTGGVSLPLLVAGGVTLLVMGIGSTVMLTRRMRGER